MSKTPSKRAYEKWQNGDTADDFLQLTQPNGSVPGWIDGTGTPQGTLATGSGSGTVHTDTTLTGDGSSGTPLSVIGVASIPGIPGVTAVPVQSGLMAEYRILSTETVASLIDYSGNGNNATGTNGTAPTIIANSGGIACGAGAVTLPSALNSALTIMVYISTQNSSMAVSTYNSPVLGAIAGSLANGTGIIFVSTVNGSATSYPETFGAGFHVTRRVAFNGAGSLAMVMANPNDILYVNGTNQTDSGGILGNGSSAGVMANPQVYQIGGAANGGSPTYFHGNVYYVVFYNRLLSANEVAQNAQFMANAMALRGVPQIFNPSDSTAQLTVNGDSISSLSFANPPWPGNLTISGSAVQIENNAAAGARLVVLQNTAPLDTDPAFRPLGERNAHIIFAGTNDLANISNAATTWGELQSYCRQRKMMGWETFMVSMLSRTGTVSEQLV